MILINENDILQMDYLIGLRSGRGDIVRLRESCMFRFSPKRSLLVRLLSSLGPPPPPPRRYFSKLSEYGGQHRADADRRDAGNRRAAETVAVRDIWRATG